MGFGDAEFQVPEVTDDKATCEIQEDYNYASMWARYDT